MIQVAWQVPNNPEWIGGLNYFVNLASALFSLTDRKVEPVLLGAAEGLPKPFDRCRVLSYPWVPTTRWNPLRILDAVGRRYLDNGGILGRTLKENGIGLLSHGQILGRRSPVPAMCWIPDFQHVHLPEFFTPQECAARDKTFNDIATRAQAVVLSSEDARKDFIRLFPKQKHKTYVLHFVAATSDVGLPPLEAVLKKYAINEPYLHVPNQLWAHKNHTIIVEALAILRRQGKCPLVISTGQTNDYRNPDYFPLLNQRVKDDLLDTRFRFLGLTPYADMATLMRGAVAMINPSLFEGWSTTVEEAKSLGKRLILSNIPVHLEQNPERGLFFDPHDPESLATAIKTVFNEYDLKKDQEYMQEAARNLPERIQKYGRDYQNIVMKVVNC